MNSQTTSRPVSRIGALAVPLLATLLLAACGGGGGGSPASAPPAPELTLDYEQVKQLKFTWNDVAGETEYRLLENPDGASGFSQVATISADASEYGHTVFLPARLNARYILQACNSAGCSDSAQVAVFGNLTGAIGKLKADNAGPGDRLSGSIALSADGTTLALGAPDEDSDANIIDGNGADDSAPDAGAVYVFVREGSAWQQQAYLKADNSEGLDRFGTSLALSADGQTLVVGAPGEDGADNGSENASGAVYVFEQTDGAWSQRAYLKASSIGDGDRFGSSLSLSADGNALAVGAPRTDRLLAVEAGAVYLFARADGNWTQQARIQADDGEAYDIFGSAVTLSPDGSTLAVGATLEDGAGNDDEDNSGAVYLYTRDGASWTFRLRLKSPAIGNAKHFGSALALSRGGGVLAVGEPGGASEPGAVHIYRAQFPDWSLWAVSSLDAGTGLTDPWDSFGGSVALSDDGGLLAIGASLEDSDATGINGVPNNDAVNAGAAYLFRHDGGEWQRMAYLKATDTEADDRFGTRVALSADGETLAVGAVWEEDDTAYNSGAVYLY